MHQIILNLCSNAYHAMSEEGGTLTVSLSVVKLTTQDVKSYINIILQIILAPVMILAGSFPGMQTQYSFGTWLKNLVAHVMVLLAALRRAHMLK